MNLLGRGLLVFAVRSNRLTVINTVEQARNTKSRKAPGYNFLACHPRAEACARILAHARRYSSGSSATTPLR